MAASAAGGGYADPFATPKANLRDTIKWLASIFAALAAVVIAGTPISNLSSASLTVSRQIVGVVAVVVCFGCICAAVVMMLRLLRADLVYLTDINPLEALDGREDRDEIEAIRSDIGSRKSHFFPDFDSLEEFFATARRADESAQSLGASWHDAVTSGASQEAVAAAKDAYAEQVKELEKFEGAQQDMLAYAAYLRFYSRVRRATPPLLALGVGALAALLVFTLVVQARKEEKAPQVVVVNVPQGRATTPSAGTSDAGTVHFETDSSDVDATGRATIEAARNALLANPQTSLLIIARTDTVGGERRNASLARERADAVRRLLVARGGIAASRVFATEVPESDLRQITDDATDSRLNRSASLYVVPLERQ